MGVSEKAVRNLLRRAGWVPDPSTQERLPIGMPTADPNLSAFSTLPVEHGADAAIANESLDTAVGKVG